MPQFRVLLAGFPGGGTTSMYTAPWLLETYAAMLHDPRIGKGNIGFWQVNGTPVTESRNKALIVAEENGFDYVLMYDSDMHFDPPYPGAKPFWDSSWEFALAHDGPCVIAAPYCGPPPHENVYVFRFEATETGDPNPNFKLAFYSRSEAFGLTGIQRAAALPTGLMLIDMRGVKRLPHPRFYYEYTDERQVTKASTEDVAFSRDMSYAGVPLYCNWDAWALHLKTKMVGKPLAIPMEAVPAWIVERSRELAEQPPADRPGGGWNEKPHGRFLLTPKPDAPPVEVTNGEAHR